ncbi:bolA-like protein 2 [Gymnodraco acuticeps]|uniref:BolA-like protein 2 n=1 Tax=Gymnodraco acuticeps TaxID=8218 RepID=A0A6P8UUY0_GYMAC|nr:bolA-like protein 2 [Gymnodraco acuticeps]
MAITADHIRDKLTKELAAIHVVHNALPPKMGPNSKPVCFLRLVNTCLAEELKEIHAFEQKTLTPEQWEKQKAQ